MGSMLKLRKRSTSQPLYPSVCVRPVMLGSGMEPESRDPCRCQRRRAKVIDTSLTNELYTALGTICHETPVKEEAVTVLIATALALCDRVTRGHDLQRCVR